MNGAAYNQIEKSKYSLDIENNLNGPSWDLLIKYFECRDKGIIDKLLHINEEMEKRIRDETVFYANQDKIPKLNFEIDNYKEWLYAIKSCIRKTTYHNYFDKKNVCMGKNYENELYDIMIDSIEVETKKQLQLENVNNNPRKLIKEILRAKHRLRSNKINLLLNYINTHKYHKKEDIHQHLEILFILFDELAKLKKVLTEEEKLEKILNSLPKDYAIKIKKLTRDSRQLGLTIIYIVKYVKEWNEKKSGFATPNLSLDENSFHNIIEIVNSSNMLEDPKHEEENEVDIRTISTIKSDSNNNINNPSEQIPNNNNNNNNIISEHGAILPLENSSKEEPSEATTIIPDTETIVDRGIHENSNADVETDVDRDIGGRCILDTDVDEILSERSIHEVETDMDREISERGIPYADTDSEVEPEQPQSKFKKIFSLRNLFLYLFLILAIKILIYFKYDILKLFS